MMCMWIKVTDKWYFMFHADQCMCVIYEGVDIITLKCKIIFHCWQTIKLVQLKYTVTV